MLPATVIPPPPAAQASAELAFWLVIAFAILALVIIAIVQIRHGIGINFLVLFGLLCVATLGVMLGLMPLPEEAATPVFTLLGAVAGYLAGIRSTDKDKELELVMAGKHPRLDTPSDNGR